MKLPLAFCLVISAVSPALADPRNQASSQSPDAEILVRVPLARGTAIELELAETVTTRSNDARKGDPVRLTVAEPVMIGNYIAIQKGTPAFGHLTLASGPGAFGKSGKIELEVDYLVLGGRRIGLKGLHRAEGRGELKTIGSIAAAGPFAPFISGDDGELERGAELTAYLSEAVGVAIPYQQGLHARYPTQAVLVRGRKIAISDAFDQALSSAEDVEAPSSTAKRPSFDEAFEDELKALKDDL